MGETGEMRARVIRGRDGGYDERSVVVVEYPGLWAQETFLQDRRKQGGDWSRTDVPSDGISSTPCRTGSDYHCAHLCTCTDERPPRLMQT